MQKQYIHSARVRGFSICYLRQCRAVWTLWRRPAYVFSKWTELQQHKTRHTSETMLITWDGCFWNHSKTEITEELQCSDIADTAYTTEQRVNKFGTAHSWHSVDTIWAANRNEPIIKLWGLHAVAMPSRIKYCKSLNIMTLYIIHQLLITTRK